MVITIAGRRWHRVFTTCLEVKGGWISTERWSLTTWTSAPVNSPLSRYHLPLDFSPCPCNYYIIPLPPSLFRQAIGVPKSISSMVMSTTVMGSKFVTYLAPGMRPSSVGKILTLPNACGELVKCLIFYHIYVMMKYTLTHWMCITIPFIPCPQPQCLRTMSTTSALASLLLNSMN